MKTTTERNTLSLVKPEHLARIGNLELRAKLIVEGMMAGMHRSPYHGFSAEFLEYRGYRQGESTRYIDWRKFAKSDRSVVRLFEDETNLFAHIVLDKSASMAFGTSPGMAKFDYAKTLAASLAWILVRQRDAVGLCAFDERMQTYLPPRSTNVQLKSIIAHLDRTRPAGQTRCVETINALAAMLGKRGMTIVISDLFDDAEAVVRGLRHLRFKRQEVIVLWVLDPMELSFGHDSPLRIRDRETGECVLLDPGIAAEHFRLGLAEHRLRIERECRGLAIDLHCIGTDEPFQKALQRILGKRGRLY